MGFRAHDAEVRPTHAHSFIRPSGTHQDGTPTRIISSHQQNEIMNNNIKDKEETTAPSTKFALTELELDGVTYRIDANASLGGIRWVRRLLCFDNDDNTTTTTNTLGPIVGCASASATNLEEFLDSLDLDPLGYSGDYVGELLGAAPVTTTQPISKWLSNNKIPTERLRQELEIQGLAVWESALSEGIVQEWRETILQQAATPFIENGQSATIRSDVVRFVSCRETTNAIDDPAAAVACQGFDVLEHVVAAVTGARLLGAAGMHLWRPDQGMMAQYLKERAAHYTWHYDNETTDGHWRNYRTLTAILYLNPLDWNVTRDGGGLECQLSSSSSTTTLSPSRIVSPNGGTLVLFDSRTIRHCVLPAHRDRLALTQWFVSPELAADDAQAPVGPRRITGDRKRKDLPPASESSTKRPSNKHGDSFCRIYNKEETIDSTTRGSGQKPSEEAPPTETSFQFGFF